MRRQLVASSSSAIDAGSILQTAHSATKGNRSSKIQRTRTYSLPVADPMRIGYLPNCPGRLPISRRLPFASLFWLIATIAHAQPPDCEVDVRPLIDGKTSTGTMHLEQDTACRFRLGFPSLGNADTWKLVTPPESGKLTFERSGFQYKPNLGFVGHDKFTIGVSGRVATSCHVLCWRNGRFEIDVTVQSKP